MGALIDFLPGTTLTGSWYTPPWIPPAEAGELLPAVQVAAGVQTFVGVYVAEAVRRIVVLGDWAAEVTTEEPAEETAALDDAIGAAVADELETVCILSNQHHTHLHSTSTQKNPHL